MIKKKKKTFQTRENALQLLIFSLVTFPSTEFKVENVANKVALMVGDKRRRVRQAALDTLAVLAQIYEPEVKKKKNKTSKAWIRGFNFKFPFPFFFFKLIFW